MGKSDEVRRLLDERGVEHRDNDANRAVRYTRWENGGKREVRYEEWSNGTTRLDAGNVTPEQAIAATVGAGTCQIETTENWLPAERYHRCRHCGAFFAVLNASHDIPPHVCPNCGRRVEVMYK